MSWIALMNTPKEDILKKLEWYHKQKKEEEEDGDK